MGYYTCPRCGGHDVYTGNVIEGRYRSAGGTNIQKVVKCRSCGEILSETENYFLTKEEKELAKGRREALFMIFVVIPAILMIIFVVFTLIFGSK